MLSPEILVAVYEKVGRQGLIDMLCIFPKENAELNKAMEDIIDCFVEALSSDSNEAEVIKKMKRLTTKFQAALSDTVLDLYNDDIIDQKTMENTFKEINKVEEPDIPSGHEDTGNY